MTYKNEIRSRQHFWQFDHSILQLDDVVFGETLRVMHNTDKASAFRDLNPTTLQASHNLKMKDTCLKNQTKYRHNKNSRNH